MSVGCIVSASSSVTDCRITQSNGTLVHPPPHAPPLVGGRRSITPFLMKRWGDHHGKAEIKIYIHLWYSGRRRLHILVLLLDEYLHVSGAMRACSGRRTSGQIGWCICDTVARLCCLVGVNLHGTGGFCRPYERTRAACHPEHELYSTFIEHDLRQTPYSSLWGNVNICGTCGYNTSSLSYC